MQLLENSTADRVPVKGDGRLRRLPAQLDNGRLRIGCPYRKQPLGPDLRFADELKERLYLRAATNDERRSLLNSSRKEIQRFISIDRHSSGPFRDECERARLVKQSLPVLGRNMHSTPHTRS